MEITNLDGVGIVWSTVDQSNLKMLTEVLIFTFFYDYLDYSEASSPSGPLYTFVSHPA